MQAQFKHLSSKNFFQWYKELFNPMDFDPYNRSLKIRESIRTLILKVGAHLGVWRFIPSHYPTLLGAWNAIPGLHFWFTPSRTFTLIASPRLRLRQLPPFFTMSTKILHMFFFFVGQVIVMLLI
jgi:hypothetical protein